jgi:hypothetical protein
MPRNSSLQAYARVGAAARLTEIETEISAIRQAFPDLAVPGSPSRRRVKSSASRKKAARTAGGRRRRKLSAAARKAISDAQKKRWAAQRAKKS